MKKFIASIFHLIYPEVWLVGIFTVLQPFIGGNRYYFIALVVLFVVIYLTSKNFLETVWLTFIATLPFSRGKYFDFVLVPAAVWGGDFDLIFRATFLFGDFLLALAIYTILSRYKKFRDKLKKAEPKVITYLPLFLFLIISFLSSYKSFFSFTSLYYFLQLMKFVMLFFVARVAFSKAATAQKSFQIFVLFLIINSLLIIAQYATGGPIGLNIEGRSEGYGIYGVYATENLALFRAGGFSPDPNVAATLIALSLPILLTNVLISNKSYVRIKWLVILLLILALILTASRTLWITAAVFGFVTIFYLKKSHSIHMPPLIKKNWIIFGVLFFLLLSPIVRQRLITLTNMFKPEGGGTYRIEHIKIGLYYLKNYLIGTGLGTFNYYMALDFSPEKSGLLPAQPHNLLAQLGAETGALGLSLFLIFLTLLLKEKFKASFGNPGNFAVFSSLCSFLLSALFFPWFLHPLMGMMLWIIIAYPLTKR